MAEVVREGDCPYIPHTARSIHPELRYGLTQGIMQQPPVPVRHLSWTHSSHCLNCAMAAGPSGAFIGTTGIGKAGRLYSVYGVSGEAF